MPSDNRTSAILSLTMPFYPIRSSYDRRRMYSMDSTAMVEDYIRALRREIENAAPDYAEFEIRAVHVGGGIAGHAADDALGMLLRDLHGWFFIPDNAHIILNVHPGMVSAETLQACRRGKVNWLRVDYVTADPYESEAMKRFLPPSAMDTSMVVLAASGLKLAFDVMLGLPGQSETSLRNTLDKAIGYGAKEIVLHRLETVPGTSFAELDSVQYRNSSSPRLLLPDDNACSALASFAEKYLTEQSFSHTAPHGWSLGGVTSEFDALDSQNCARIGFGLGAETRMDGIEAVNTMDMTAYLRYSGDPEKITATVRAR